MKAALKRHGNSRGITLPPSLLERLGWKEGTELDLQVRDGALLIYPLAPSLDELLASVPAGYAATEEDWSADVEKETVE